MIADLEKTPLWSAELCVIGALSALWEERSDSIRAGEAFDLLTRAEALLAEELRRRAALLVNTNINEERA